MRLKALVAYIEATLLSYSIEAQIVILDKLKSIIQEMISERASKIKKEELIDYSVGWESPTPDEVKQALGNTWWGN